MLINSNPITAVRYTDEYHLGIKFLVTLGNSSIWIVLDYQDDDFVPKPGIELSESFKDRARKLANQFEEEYYMYRNY